MNHLALVLLAFAAVIFPCVVARLCMPLDDGRKL
ncbi:hypothetical protein SAMN05443244_1971 [Terriglobus roseus]|uniref:Uncharacterized protein n=1 Tax=Terriglobus roseus TaxID=392734 RepID=A0A1H4MMB5_9BACT|nr:hypothetical protein SAMN05443244_1971 [Terriglobus roseus]